MTANAPAPAPEPPTGCPAFTVMSWDVLSSPPQRQTSHLIIENIAEGFLPTSSDHLPSYLQPFVPKSSFNTWLHVLIYLYECLFPQETLPLYKTHLMQRGDDPTADAFSCLLISKCRRQTVSVLQKKRRGQAVNSEQIAVPGLVSPQEQRLQSAADRLLISGSSLMLHKSRCVAVYPVPLRATHQETSASSARLLTCSNLFQSLY